VTQLIEEYIEAGALSWRYGQTGSSTVFPSAGDLFRSGPRRMSEIRYIQGKMGRRRIVRNGGIQNGRPVSCLRGWKKNLRDWRARYIEFEDSRLGRIDVRLTPAGENRHH